MSQPRPTRGMTTNERFDYYTVASPFGCLLWTGATFGVGGYGAFYADGKTAGAHRYAYQRAHGQIPAGLFVCHRCDEPQCVNPDHLFLGTHEDNTRDMVEKARVAHGERQHLAKLTEDQVRFARITDAPGVEVARMLGVSTNTVSRIRNGLIWRHIR